MRGGRKNAMRPSDMPSRRRPNWAGTIGQATDVVGDGVDYDQLLGEAKARRTLTTAHVTEMALSEVPIALPQPQPFPHSPLPVLIRRQLKRQGHRPAVKSTEATRLPALMHSQSEPMFKHEDTIPCPPNTAGPLSPRRTTHPDDATPESTPLADACLDDGRHSSSADADSELHDARSSAGAAIDPSIDPQHEHMKEHLAKFDHWRVLVIQQQNELKRLLDGSSGPKRLYA